MSEQSNAPAAVEFTLEQFNAAIEALSRGQARVAKAVGQAILMALYFANAKGDPGAANALIGCLRKSTKKDGIIALLETHGNLCYAKIGKKDPGFMAYDNKQAWTPDAVKVLRGVCAGWEDFKPVSSGPDSIDVIDKVTKLVKSVKDALKDQKTVKHAELIDAVNAALATYTAALADAGDE